jgi:hypothetical protein
MFQNLNSRNRYAVLYRIETATRAETRSRRIEQFVAMLARGETIYPNTARDQDDQSMPAGRASAWLPAATIAARRPNRCSRGSGSFCCTRTGYGAVPAHAAVRAHLPMSGLILVRSASGL